jgi:hypothetical protein
LTDALPALPADQTEPLGPPRIGPLINVHKAMMATQRNSTAHLVSRLANSACRPFRLHRFYRKYHARPAGGAILFDRLSQHPNQWKVVTIETNPALRGRRTMR